jgi:uncharacterized protein (DUF433 family)
VTLSQLDRYFLGIERLPDVAGGDACLARTRIPVWVLVQARKLGSSDSDVLQAYHMLQEKDLVNAWAYYDAHSIEIESPIAANEAG